MGFKYFSAPNGGALSTAGGLVVAGDSDGNLIMLHAQTRRHVWHVQLETAIYSPAVTYQQNGKQNYVVVPAGSKRFALAVSEP
jgi:glucose dehydrogenase